LSNPIGEAGDARCDRPDVSVRRPLECGYIRDMMIKKLAALAGVAVIVSAPFAPAVAKVRAGHQIFQGLVEHVSPNNLKVVNPKTKQELSFLLVPHFDKIFKGDGQTTAQESELKEGAYVKVYYDQKALGARHADRILMLNNANTPINKMKS
jgi:hypothetical protein